MAFEDPRKERTPLRLRLLANGFEPIPLLHKQPFLEGWSKLEITSEVIESREWHRNGRLKDTGIRCGAVVALDFDIDDQEILDELIGDLHDAGLLDEEHPFVRLSKAPRELWVYRTNEPFRKRTTGKYDADMEYQIEVLGTGNQFAAYGLHSSGIAYSWPEAGLLESQYRDLPEITLEEAEAIIAFAREFFEQRGFERVTRAGTGNGFQALYDLAPEMVFETKDMGAVSVEELIEALRAEDDLKIRCALDPLVPGQTNTDRCIATLHGADGICISDFGDEQAHFLGTLDVHHNIDRLQQLIREGQLQLGALPEAELNPEDLELVIGEDFNDALTKATRRYVFWPQANQVVDILKPEMHVSLTPLNAFKTMTSKWSIEGPPGPRGGAGPITRLGDAWAIDERREDIDAVTMRPDQPEPFFNENHVRYFNTYRKITFDVSGSPDMGIDFMERLLPDFKERQWFLQWLKFKYENPHIPGPGIIMVADSSYGTGRGRLFKLLSMMFGHRYVRNLTFNELAGNTSQAVYTEWMDEALIVVADEAKENRLTGKTYHQGVNAYEKLKSLIDPAPRYVPITRKGLPNYQGYTCCSMIIATNHKDAIIVPRTDRRLAVLTNGAPPPLAFWEAFTEWMETPGNIGAFVTWICGSVSLEGYSPYAIPLSTRAKESMVEAGVSDLDHVFDLALESFTGPVVSKMQMVARVGQMFEGNDLTAPEFWEQTIGHMWKVRLHALSSSCPGYKIQHLEKTQYPRAIESRNVDAMEAMTRAEVREALKLNDTQVKNVRLGQALGSVGG